MNDDVKKALELVPFGYKADHAQLWMHLQILAEHIKGESARIAELVAEREALRTQILDVHDALHSECDGKADLPREIRALRATHAEALDALRLVVDEFGWVSTIEDGHDCIDPVLAVLAKQRFADGAR